MCGTSLLLFLALFGQLENEGSYGWQIHPDDGVLEYIVQISPSAAAAMERGEERFSAIPPELVGRASRVVIRIGSERLPRTPSLADIKRMPIIADQGGLTSMLGPGQLKNLENAPVVQVQGGANIPPLDRFGQQANSRLSDAAESLVDKAQQAAQQAAQQTLPNFTLGDQFLSGTSGNQASAPAPLRADSGKFSNTAPNTQTQSQPQLPPRPITNSNNPADLARNNAGLPSSSSMPYPSTSPSTTGTNRWPQSTDNRSTSSNDSDWMNRGLGSNPAQPGLPYSNNPYSTSGNGFPNQNNPNFSNGQLPNNQLTNGPQYNQAYPTNNAQSFDSRQQPGNNFAANDPRSLGNPFENGLQNRMNQNSYGADPYSPYQNPTSPYQAPSFSSPNMNGNSGYYVASNSMPGTNSNSVPGSGFSGSVQSPNNLGPNSGNLNSTAGNLQAPGFNTNPRDPNSVTSNAPQKRTSDNFLQVFFILSLVVNGYLAMLLRKLLGRYRTLLMNMRNQVA